MSKVIDTKVLMQQLEARRIVLTCAVCREFTPEVRAFVTEAMRKGYTYAEVATILEPYYGKVQADIKRHRKNGHSDERRP